MVDLQTVYCMRGDVGFPDKLFRCCKCRHRLQHSYCSSYNREASDPIEMSDWCQSADKTNARHGNSSKKSAVGNNPNRSEYSGVRVGKQNDPEDVTVAEKGKTPTGEPSPRTATRRYKLLKDVMC